MAPPRSARTRSVGTKLTEEEYARLEAAAARCGRTVGEWCREELLHAAVERNSAATAAGIHTPVASPAEEILLAEVLALRTILLNLFYDLAAGETPSAARMQELLAKADGEKSEKALRRLKSQASGEAA